MKVVSGQMDFWVCMWRYRADSNICTWTSQYSVIILAKRAWISLNLFFGVTSSNNMMIRLLLSYSWYKYGDRRLIKRIFFPPRPLWSIRLEFDWIPISKVDFRHVLIAGVYFGRRLLLGAKCSNWQLRHGGTV